MAENIRQIVKQKILSSIWIDSWFVDLPYANFTLSDIYGAIDLLKEEGYVSKISELSNSWRLTWRRDNTKSSIRIVEN